MEMIATIYMVIAGLAFLFGIGCWIYGRYSAISHQAELKLAKYMFSGFGLFFLCCIWIILFMLFDN